jgi:hypothetical protein
MGLALKIPGKRKITAKQGRETMAMERLFQLMKEKNASDMFFAVNSRSTSRSTATSSRSTSKSSTGKHPLAAGRNRLARADGRTGARPTS